MEKNTIKVNIFWFNRDCFLYNYLESRSKIIANKENDEVQFGPERALTIKKYTFIELSISTAFQGILTISMWSFKVCRKTITFYAVFKD